MILLDDRLTPRGREIRGRLTVLAVPAGALVALAAAARAVTG